VPVDDLRILAFAIVFGGLMGWGLGRRAEDRLATTIATGVSTLAGVGCWIAALAIDAPTGGALATAAVSLTGGAGAALAVLAFTGRR
jgi:hypothetical protein